MEQSIYVVIMAGGQGERFWPMSRESLPKQFLTLHGGRSLLQQTFDRLSGWIPASHICVVTGQRHEALVRQQLPELFEENLLLEPAARDTAACVGTAAVWLQQRDENPILVVLPSDHLIAVRSGFLSALNEAVDLAVSTDGLVTIGLEPTRPETGYGYIEIGPAMHVGSTYKVSRFVEKPTAERALEFLQSGRFLWNSGMFVWTARSIRSQIEKHIPALHEGLQLLGDAGRGPFAARMADTFPTLHKISIDHGVLEKSDRVYVVQASFGWDDLGSWLALERLRVADDRGNCLKGPVLLEDSANLIVEADRRLVVAFGVEDLILVDTPDVVMICHKRRAPELKRMVARVREWEMANNTVHNQEREGAS